MAPLAEVDSRRLYLGQGYRSLFAWCTHVLHLSEPAAYSRITAARAARRYPRIFTQLADDDVTLTTVTLLSAHLTDENQEALLEAVPRDRLARVPPCGARCARRADHGRES